MKTLKDLINMYQGDVTQREDVLKLLDMGGLSATDKRKNTHAEKVVYQQVIRDLQDLEEEPNLKGSSLDFAEYFIEWRKHFGDNILKCLESYSNQPTSTELDNIIYASIIGECESMESEKIYRGNGHHLAQKLTALISKSLSSYTPTEQPVRKYTEEQAKVIWKAGQEYWKTSGASITFEQLTQEMNIKATEQPSLEWVEASEKPLTGESILMYEKCGDEEILEFGSIDEKGIYWDTQDEQPSQMNPIKWMYRKDLIQHLLNKQPTTESKT